MKFLSDEQGCLINLQKVEYIEQEELCLIFYFGSTKIPKIITYKSKIICDEVYEEIMDFIKSNEKLLEI